MTDYIETRPAPRRIRFDPTRERGREDFGHAERHSRRVRWLRIALPLGAAAAVVGFFLAMQFETGGDLVSLAGINIDSKSLEMKAPHISGFEGTKRAYDMKATTAVQDLDNPKVVTLDKITAKFGLDDNGDSTATLDATTGVFDGATNFLTLKNGMTLVTTDGYQAILDDAHIDVAKGDLVSKKPVEIRSGDGVIKANAVTVTDRGKNVLFSGGVTVTFTPSEPQSFLPLPDESTN